MSPDGWIGWDGISPDRSISRSPSGDNKSCPARFWARLRTRTEWQPWKQARWRRRRSWRLLEEDAGKKSFCKTFKSQVNFSFTFFGKSYRWLSKLKNALLSSRDLDPAYHRPSCYCGLCYARNCLLQQWWLIPFSFCPWWWIFQWNWKSYKCLDGQCY